MGSVYMARVSQIRVESWKMFLGLSETYGSRVIIFLYNRIHKLFREMGVPIIIGHIYLKKKKIMLEFANRSRRVENRGTLERGGRAQRIISGKSFKYIACQLWLIMVYLETKILHISSLLLYWNPILHGIEIFSVVTVAVLWKILTCLNWNCMPNIAIISAL